MSLHIFQNISLDNLHYATVDTIRQKVTNLEITANFIFTHCRMSTVIFDRLLAAVFETPLTPVESPKVRLELFSSRMVFFSALCLKYEVKLRDYLGYLPSRILGLICHDISQ